MEFLTHETRSEMHQQCTPSRDIDDKSISAKLDDDQRCEALVVRWWWMVNLWSKGSFENGVSCGTKLGDDEGRTDRLHSYSLILRRGRF
jgi:hypothetical protein